MSSSRRPSRCRSSRTRCSATAPSGGKALRSSTEVSPFAPRRAFVRGANDDNLAYDNRFSNNPQDSDSSRRPCAPRPDVSRRASRAPRPLCPPALGVEREAQPHAAHGLREIRQPRSGRFAGAGQAAAAGRGSARCWHRRRRAGNRAGDLAAGPQGDAARQRAEENPRGERDRDGPRPADRNGGGSRGRALWKTPATTCSWSAPSVRSGSCSSGSAPIGT